MGHWEGAEALHDIVKAASELGVQTLTAYCFSTENWKRSAEEVESLMEIFRLYLELRRETMLAEGVRLCAIGDITHLPGAVRQALEETRKVTSSCQTINLVLALNYGGRDEICRAVRCLALDIQQGTIRPEEVTESLLSGYLDTSSFGDPDLVIRTGGEVRMSNFLSWQTSYAELMFVSEPWPEFTPRHFLEAVRLFQERERRVGGL
jgi:undecaprenyl diphosphate synthase